MSSTVRSADQSPDELGQLGRAFDLMQIRLDRADRVRKEFVANASHELRTPLFSLSGFMELMDDEDLDDETRAAFLQQMREQVNRLTKLATDLLDLSRLDADAVAVEHEPIDMAAAARGLVREFRGLAVGHGSRISLVKPDARAAARDRRRAAGAAGGQGAARQRHPAQPVGHPGARRCDRRTTAACGWTWPTTGRSSTIRPPVTCSSGSTAVRPQARPGSGLGLAIARELAERMDGRLELLESTRARRGSRSAFRPSKARLTCVNATDRNHCRDRRIGGRRGGRDRDGRDRVLERRLRRIDHRDHAPATRPSPRST